MLDRRRFLKTSAGAVLGGALVTATGCSDTDAPAPGTHAAAGAAMIERIGVQLYTVRSLLADDFEGTLRQVAEIGYDEFEFAGYYDRTPQQIRQLLDELGVTAPSAHIGYETVRDDLDGVIEAARTVGHEYIVVPALPGDMRESLDAYRTVADVLNTAGERLQQEGMRIGYHNHAFEFEARDGQIPYDVLLSETDPDLVDMELDLFWIRAAGYDPVAYFEQHPGRFALCHVKDMTVDGEMAAVGDGETDFRQIFSHAEQAGLKHYIVEHDRPDDALQSIRTSYAYLQGLGEQA